MHLTIPTSTFRLGIARSADAVNPASTLPVITNLLLEASGSALTITGTNLDQQARVEVTCDVHKEGSTTLPAKKLAKIVGAVGSDNIVLQMDDNKGLLIADEDEFKLTGLDASDFPKELFPAREPVATWDFKASELRRIFVQLAPMQSADDSRYVLMGIHLQGQGNKLDWTATDGRALGIITTEHEGQEANAILPSDFVRQGVLAMESEEEVSLSLTENSVKLTGKSITLTSKLVEGNYPSVRAAIPEGLPNHIELPREEFLKRIAVLSTIGEDQNKQNVVTLVGTKNNLEIILNSVTDSSRRNMPLKISEPFKYHLNRRFIDAALRNLPDDSVRMEYGESTQPVIFRAGDYAAVVSIIRTKDDV